jgi:hypothetical protein
MVELSLVSLLPPHGDVPDNRNESREWICMQVHGALLRARISPDKYVTDSIG